MSQNFLLIAKKNGFISVAYVNENCLESTPVAEISVYMKVL